MRILKNDCVGLIIDIQEKLFPHIYENERMLSRNEILIAGLQELDVPMLVTEQYTKGLGQTISPIKKLFTTFHSLEKISFSCFDDDLIASKLRSFARKNIIIAGIEAHVCVLQTVLDMLEHGLRPVVVEDCISSRQEHDKIIALERMARAGAIITTSESVLFELTRFTGNDIFKAISTLVK